MEKAGYSETFVHVCQTMLICPRRQILAVVPLLPNGWI